MKLNDSFKSNIGLILFILLHSSTFYYVSTAYKPCNKNNKVFVTHIPNLTYYEG